MKNSNIVQWLLLLLMWVALGAGLCWQNSVWEQVWADRSDQFFPDGWVHDRQFEDFQKNYPIYQSNDTYYWVRLADSLVLGDRERLIFLTDEGVGEGRDNAWHPFPAYLLYHAASIKAGSSQEEQRQEVRRLAHFLGPFVGWVLLLPASVLLALVAGPVRATFFMPLFFFNPAIQWDFGYSRYDHEIWFHLALFLQIVGLTAVLRGNSWVWGALAAVGAAWGWWTVPSVQVAFGFVAILALVFARFMELSFNPSSQQKVPLASENKQFFGFLSWGIAGACFVFFILLFTSDVHFGADITALHPVHLAAQLGAGLFASALFLRGSLFSGSRICLLVCGILLGLAPLFWLIVHGMQGHVWLDPFQRSIHSYITEFQSIFKSGYWAGLPFWLSLIVFIISLTIGVLRRNSSQYFLVFFAVALFLLALYQVRWMGLWSLTAILLLVLSSYTWKRYMAVNGILVVFLSLIWWFHWTNIQKKPDDRFVADLLLQVGARDVNLNLQSYSGGEPVRVVMPFDFAAPASLFDEIMPVGSFYWENRDGLYISTKILASVEDDKALDIITVYEIDYIVVQSGHLGVRFAEMALHSQYDGLYPLPPLEDTLAWRLSYGKGVPDWCELLDFSGTLDATVMDVKIYRINRP